jgi:hypothetical protein
VTTTQDEIFSIRIFNPEVVFFSKDKALLYAAVNFREPNEHFCQSSKGVNWYEDRP